MLDPNWVLLSLALGLAASLRYARATLQGRASPNRVTWVLWAAAPLIAFFAQLDAGVGMPALPTLSAGLGPLIVLTASFLSRHGQTRITAFDLVCGSISVVALIIWVGLGSAPWAVAVAVAADGAAGVPTVRKAWREPHTENALFYAIAGVGAIITLLTITDPAPASWLFAAYILTLSIVLTAVITGRRARGEARAGGTAQ